MTNSKRNGQAGEEVVAQLLYYAPNLTVLARQYEVLGHRIDFLIEHDGQEVLVEVKTWAENSGTDTVKKAIADAYDLHHHAWPRRPYWLALSKEMRGLNGEMLERAQEVGAIAKVIVFGLMTVERKR